MSQVPGEYRHLVHHAQLTSTSKGIPEENIIFFENGRVLDVTSDSAKMAGRVAAGLEDLM